MSLSPQRWQEVKALLDGALGLAAEDRSRFLDRASDDPELCRLAHSFLAAYTTDSAFVPAAWRGDGSTSVGAGAPLELSEPIGPYRLLRRLGAGGMGEVFLAEQEVPIRRRVALKVMRAGLSGSQVAARFEAERQALALMSHPNIARIFDAGESQSGRPYVVMEYIEGSILTDHCDAGTLSPSRRLELFLAVCRGVQHAHQKGVIHRDLKPSNVLVAIEDGMAVPKIIDFGIAKALAESTSIATLHTEQGQWIGTPEYMSPEQASGPGAEVDTRSDVYSLGALLYELLTGVQPFDPQQLRQAGLAAMLTALREQEPPRMSARVRELGARASKAAGARGLKETQLESQLRGDLDQIVQKALEKDPDRRYASAAELAADVGRYLRHEPVLVGHPGTGAHLRKLVRRHRLAVTAAGLVLLSLVAGIVGTSLSLVRARRAELRAREESRQAEEQAAKAREVTRFLLEVFKNADPRKGLRPDMTLREILDQNAVRARTALATQPRVQAEVLLAMGESYFGLAQYDAARSLLEQSLEIRRREFGPRDPEVADCLHDLARVAIELADYGRARELLEGALAIRAEHLDPRDPRLASSLNLLGTVLKKSGDRQGAEDRFDRALAIYESQPEVDSVKVAMVLDNLGLLAVEMGRNAEGQVHLERAVRLQEQALGPHHPELAFGLNNLAMALTNQGDNHRAEELFARAVEIDRAAYGPHHPNVAFGLHNLGELALAAGDCRGAVALFEQGLFIFRQHLPAEHPTMREVLRMLRIARACS